LAADKQPHNLNALVIGTGEFSFAAGAASLVAAQLIGWLDFDNVTTGTIQSKSTTKEHKGSYRGIKRLDKTHVTDTKIGYQLKFDAIDAMKVNLLFRGTRLANYTQVVRTAAAADAIAAPVQGRWYDINIGGLRVREITALVASVGVEDTDYIVDYKTGRIRSLTATGFGTLTVTAPAILVTSANTFARITPATTPIARGMGRLSVWNDDGTLVLEHYDFYCEVIPTADPNINDSDMELTFDVNVLTPVGEVGAPYGAQQS
jgi:hypothetical protein